MKNHVAYIQYTHYISIDKSMVGMKNHIAYTQYMPNKHHSRCGIKRFELCDALSGYVIHVELYAGKDFPLQCEMGKAHGVVRDFPRQCEMGKAHGVAKAHGVVRDFPLQCEMGKAHGVAKAHGVVRDFPWQCEMGKAHGVAKAHGVVRDFPRQCEMGKAHGVAKAHGVVRDFPWQCEMGKAHGVAKAHGVVRDFPLQCEMGKAHGVAKTHGIVRDFPLQCEMSKAHGVAKAHGVVRDFPLQCEMGKAHGVEMNLMQKANLLNLIYHLFTDNIYYGNDLGNEGLNLLAPYARLFSTGVFQELSTADNGYFAAIMKTIISEAGPQSEAEAIGFLEGVKISNFDVRWAQQIGVAAVDLVREEALTEKDVGEAVKRARIPVDQRPPRPEAPQPLPDAVHDNEGPVRITTTFRKKDRARPSRNEWHA